MLKVFLVYICTFYCWCKHSMGILSTVGSLWLCYNLRKCGQL